MWQRRAFLKAAGAGFAASLMPLRAQALERADLVFASAIQKKQGGFAAALVTEYGDLVASVDLPDRGHDITYSAATGKAVAFARQPGTFAVVFDARGSERPLTLTSVPGRHFFGHGVFSPDGRLLYATENDFENARGVIGIFDATDGFRRIGEFDTFGTGPHEIILLPDNKTFAIANGGIETHPDYGRSELNIDTMDPSLAFVDSSDGSLVGQLRLSADLHQVSIRHMVVDSANRVWFGCQFRGPAEDRPQLVGYATLDGEIRLIELPADNLASLDNYVGAIEISADKAVVAVSSSTGNTILAIDAATARPLLSAAMRSGSGLARDGKGFLATSGWGEMMGVAGSTAPRQQFDFNFDAHLRRLG